MKNSLLILVMSGLLGILPSCKKSDDGPTGPNLPLGTVAEVEPNDLTAQSLGTLGTSDASVAGSTASATDVDRYSITLSAVTNLHVSLTWQGGSDLNVGVMNTSSIMINYQGGSISNPERCTLSSQPAGTYVIEVTSATAAATAYTLTIGSR
jgi:hypothetical protein